MSLSDFFRINFPYGIKRNSKGEWFAFNREYVPIGWNSTRNHISIYADEGYPDLPIYTKYKNISEKTLLKIANEDGASVRKVKDGKINIVFFYNDKNNPQSNPKAWSEYFEKVKILSNLNVKSNI